MNRIFRYFSTYSQPPTKKTTIETIRSLYKSKTPITMMTAHDYPSGYFTAQAGIDITLIGDSLAMVALGHETTLQITLDEMMHHSRAVARGATTPFLVGDMPFGSYESSDLALKNAIRYVKEGRVEAVKLEGGVEMAATIEQLTKVGIPVLGHIGLTPQRVASLGGFKAQGRTVQKAKKLLEDAIALEQAGCFAVILEAIPEAVANLITKNVSVPTIGIGAGPGCSGQVLVQLDILGVYDKLAPKFSKIYSNVGKSTLEALTQYKDEVRERKFPLSGSHTYKMLPGEEELLKEWIHDQESKLSSGI